MRDVNLCSALTTFKLSDGEGWYNATVQFWKQKGTELFIYYSWWCFPEKEECYLFIFVNIMRNERYKNHECRNAVNSLARRSPTVDVMHPLKYHWHRILYTCDKTTIGGISSFNGENKRKLKIERTLNLMDWTPLFARAWDSYLSPKNVVKLIQKLIQFAV
jgi:hypothetical protein